MDHDPKETPRTANVVGIGANLVCDPDDRKRTRYPVEWKECCRDIFKEYRRYKSETEGGEYSWTRIRNQIMRKYDVYEGTRIVEESTLLSRQNLESFVRHGKMLNDDKFKFLDHFTHENLLDPTSDFSIAAERVIAYREKLQQECFHVLYLGDRRHVDKNVSQYVSHFSERLFILESPPDEDEKLGSAIYLKPQEYACFSVVFIYYRNSHLFSFDTSVRHGYKYFGYFLPLSLHDHDGKKTWSYGVLNLFDRSQFNTKPAFFHSAAHGFLSEQDTSILISGISTPYNPLRYATMGERGQKKAAYIYVSNYFSR
ncbi:hypothetical protein FF098_015840 [Parvularcula flava]|uniref:Uncharacterized protein n=1 Tax=Aquisalinus luteolus TaxID=1566827 RepID=A0ABX0HRS6_9PROT|nr:hypothetical protein [Aquisalinus luteolus]NHK29387.1 hypothetical protein [Aquisalinus luteolus]